MSREVGRLSGCYHYAEGWTRHLPLGLGDDADPLAAVLSDAVFVPAAQAGTG